MRIRAVHVPFVHGPGMRQCMVDHSDFVMDDLGIGLIEVDALPENGLIIEVKGEASGVVDARPLEAARFRLEQVIVAIAILVDPPPDRIARIAWFNLLGPVAAVGENAARLCADQNIGRVRRDDEFQRSECHHMRHAGGHAAGAVKIVALTASGLVGNAVLENLFIFRCERGLLSASPRPGLIERRLASRRAKTGRGNHGHRWDPPFPRALPFGIFHTVVRFDAAADHRRRTGHSDCTEQFSVTHGVPPLGSFLRIVSRIAAAAPFTSHRHSASGALLETYTWPVGLGSATSPEMSVGWLLRGSPSARPGKRWGGVRLTSVRATHVARVLRYTLHGSSEQVSRTEVPAPERRAPLRPVARGQYPAASGKAEPRRTSTHNSTCGCRAAQQERPHQLGR